jgi:hypothetical protein
MDGYTYLSDDQMNLRDKIHLIIKNFSLYFPNEIEKTEIKK